MARDRSGAVRVGIVGVVAAVAVIGGLALSGTSPEGSPTRAVGRAAPTGGAADDPPGLTPAPPPGETLQQWGHEALVSGPTPAGKEPIIFDDGGVPGLAGYVDVQDPDDDGGRPGTVLDIGSGRHEARGDEVTDADGVLLGYDVSGIGLVDLETARDVEVVDALLAEGEARARAAQGRSG